MKKVLLLTILTLPLSLLAQGPNTNVNPAVQGVQSNKINYYIEINNDDNIISQQANPPPPKQQGGGLGNLFGSNTGNEAPCTDCDKVKKAIKLSRSSSAGGNSKKAFSMKRWSKTFSGKVHMKMKKTFARKHRVRSNYSLCFNWS